MPGTGHSIVNQGRYLGTDCRLAIGPCREVGRQCRHVQIDGAKRRLSVLDDFAVGAATIMSAVPRTLDMAGRARMSSDQLMSGAGSGSDICQAVAHVSDAPDSETSNSLVLPECAYSIEQDGDDDERTNKGTLPERVDAKQGEAVADDFDQRCADDRAECRP